MSRPGDGQASLNLDVLGTRFAVACTDPGLRSTLSRWWAPFLVSGPQPPMQRRQQELELVLDNGEATLVTPGSRVTYRQVRPALSELLVTVNREALRGAAFFATHAGVAGYRDGSIALVAASGVGKSTLTAACLLEGCSYVSDEALCLDWHSAALVGYPRPLCLGRWSRDRLGLAAGWPALPGTPDSGEEIVLAAADLGAEVADPPPPLRHLVLLAPPALGAPVLEPSTRQEGAAQLLARSFNHWRDPAAAFAVAHEAAAGTTTWRLRAGDPRATARLLIETLGDQS